MKERFSFRITGIFVLAIFTLAVSLIAVGTGSVKVSPSEIVEIFLSSTHHEGMGVIIMDIRLPRVIMALITGGVLAAAGAAFQSLLRNPLADPYILGVSGGAALGGVAAITLGWDYRWGSVQFFAFAGALSTILFVYFISRVDGRIPKYKMLLAGVVVNAFLSSLIMLLLSVSSSDVLGSSLFWLMGDLGGASWESIRGIIPYLLAGLTTLLLLSKEMNLLLLGEEQAMELGVNVERVKILLFISASLITGAVVSVCGLIGFVGLIVPHGARLIWGADHRYLLPLSMLMGGAFLVMADTAARTVIAPIELPAGVVTAIIGGPAFVFLMKRKLHE